ncbi:MAG: hypothetical protein P8X80_15570 [Desulfobacterales bacterium]
MAISLSFFIFAGLLFLPAILSSNLLKPRILEGVNRHVPGQLQVSEWMFKWFGGIEAKGIIYDHRQENLYIEIAELKGYRGLVQLLLERGHLGGVEIVKPQVVFYLSDKQPSEVSKKAEPPPSGALPAFSGLLKITDGTIRTVNAAGSQKTVVKDLDLYLDISDIEKPIAYQAFLTSGDSVGTLSGKGTLTLSAKNPLDLKAIQSDARLEITNWELEERLELWGGPLGADHPRIKGITTELDGTLSREALSLNQLKLQSSLVNGSARGRFAGRGQSQLEGSAIINLAEVFTQLPGTLNLHQGLTLSEGKLALTATVNSTPEATAFESSARIDQFKGLKKGKPVAWNQPVSLRARGRRSSQGIRIDDFSLRSSFLNGDGQGDLSTLRVTLSADMAAALRELKKFLDIEAWDGSGKLFARFQMDETAPKTSAAAVNLDIRNLALSRNRMSILPKQDVKADFSAKVHRGAGLIGSKFQQPEVTIQSSMARGKFSATLFQLNPGESLPTADNLLIDGNFNLQQISNLLRNFRKLPLSTRLAGTTHIQSSGSMDAQHLVLNSTRIDTRNFRYHDGEKTLSDDRLVLETEGKPLLRGFHPAAGKNPNFR